MTALLDQIKSQVILMDGAMGSALQARGLSSMGLPDAWNVEKPQLVLETHGAYVQAGTQLLFTNTFGSSRNRLNTHQLQHKLQAFNQAGIRLARQAMGKNGFVAGSIGPLGSLERPFGDLSLTEIHFILFEQTRIFMEEGADAVVLETFFDAEEIRACTAVMPEITEGRLPVILMMTLNREGMLLDGTDPLQLLPDLQQNGISIVGFNCSEGPSTLFPAFQRLRQATTLPLAIKPNAGLPKKKGKDLLYPIGDDEFSEWIDRFVKEGANLVGGCCGTTAKTIRKVKEKLSLGSKT